MKNQSKILSYLFVIIFLITLSCSNPKKSKVYFIPSLHGLHKTNQKYNYDSLKAIVSRLNPDVIAVEIRPEDIDQDSLYLKESYPHEMWEMRYWFPDKTIEGFDWLGDDIEGVLIPDEYWENTSKIMKYRRALRKDSIYSNKCAECDSILKERINLIKDVSLKDILNSNDSKLTKEYYKCLKSKLDGSIHERLIRFNDKRDKKILANIKSIVQDNKGKTIVIITGDDHYVMLKDKFDHQNIF